MPARSPSSTDPRTRAWRLSGPRPERSGSRGRQPRRGSRRVPSRSLERCDRPPHPPGVGVAWSTHGARGRGAVSHRCHARPVLQGDPPAALAGGARQPLLVERPPADAVPRHRSDDGSGRHPLDDVPGRRFLRMALQRGSDNAARAGGTGGAGGRVATGRPGPGARQQGRSHRPARRSGRSGHMARGSLRHDPTADPVRVDAQAPRLPRTGARAHRDEDQQVAIMLW